LGERGWGSWGVDWVVEEEEEKQYDMVDVI